ncbi:MAG: hypothetical protein EHM35_13020, partial [Planctomycetaceae bacterium]
MQSFRVAQMLEMGAAGAVPWNPGLPKNPACVALYRLEKNSAFLLDTKANVNHLTQGAAAIVSQTAYVRERKGAGQSNGSTQYAYRNDGDLSADFPGKAGTTNYQVSCILWMRPTSLPSAGNFRCVCGKGLIYNDYSWAVGHRNNGGMHRIYAMGSVTGAAQMTWDNDQMSPVANRWYHVGFSYDSPARAARVLVYDLTADTEYDKTFAGVTLGNLYQGAGPFTVGKADSVYNSWFAGQFDEVAVFNGIVSAADMR